MQKKPRKFTEDDLKDMQALPLERKIQISQTRIIEYIQKTGGKCAMPVYAKDCPGWLNWNPKKIWVPGHAGLGYRVMLDMVNSVYGKNFIRYD